MKRDAICLLIFDFALEYATGNFQENEERLQPNGTNQFLICTNDDLLDESFTITTETVGC